MAFEYKIGDYVWGKLKGFPPWPGRVCEPRKNLKKPLKKSMQCIFFYATHDYAPIDVKNIKPYLEYQKEFCNQAKSASFKAAIVEIEDCIKRKAEDPNFQELEYDENEEEEEEEEVSESPDEDFDKLKNSTFEEKPEVVKKKPVKRISSVKPASLKRRKLSSGDDTKTSVSPARVSNHVRNYQSILNRPAVLEYVDSPAIDISAVPEGLKEKSWAPSTKKFGFIGLGIMGSGMVKNLIHSGHHINLWNRSPEKAEDIKRQADLINLDLVKTCLTPADVVESSDIIFCCVSDPTAVKQVIHGNCGILYEKNCMLGKGYVEMSNIDNDTSMDMCKLINNNGGRYLEAKLQGSRQEAIDGTLIVLGAGDRTLFDDCDSCMKAIGKTVFYLGEVGFATKMNLVLQVMRGVSLAGLAEVFALADVCGLVLEDVLKVFTKTTLCSPFLKSKSEQIISTSFSEVQQSLQNMQKDMRLSLQLADVLKQPLPLASAANEVYKHVRRVGYDSHDASSVYMRARH